MLNATRNIIVSFRGQDLIRKDEDPSEDRRFVKESLIKILSDISKLPPPTPVKTAQPIAPAPAAPELISPKAIAKKYQRLAQDVLWKIKKEHFKSISMKDWDPLLKLLRAVTAGGASIPKYRDIAIKLLPQIESDTTEVSQGQKPEKEGPTKQDIKDLDEILTEVSKGNPVNRLNTKALNLQKKMKTSVNKNFLLINILKNNKNDLKFLQNIIDTASSKEDIIVNALKDKEHKDNASKFLKLVKDYMARASQIAPTILADERALFSCFIKRAFLPSKTEMTTTDWKTLVKILDATAKDEVPSLLRDMARELSWKIKDEQGITATQEFFADIVKTAKEKR